MSWLIDVGRDGQITCDGEPVESGVPFTTKSGERLTVTRQNGFIMVDEFVPGSAALTCDEQEIKPETIR
jgi:hypothetical protein